MKKKNVGHSISSIDQRNKPRKLVKILGNVTVKKKRLFLNICAV